MFRSTGWRSIGELAGIQIVLWTLAGHLAGDAPPLDVVENSLWGPLWLISSYKNPALSSWVLEIARLLTGVVGWPAYLAAELFIAGTFALVYALGRTEMGERRALAGTLLLTGVYYFWWPAIEFNQDVAQLPFWAGAALAVWRAVATQRTGWWLLLGAFAAAAMYAKLSSAVFLIVIAAWLALDRKGRSTFTTAGPWLGLGLFILGVLPLAHWLLVNEFEPLSYAVGRGNRNAIPVLVFPFSQILALGGLLLMLAIAGMYWRKPVHDAINDERISERFVHFLAVLTLAPILLAMALAALAGAGMRPMWGTTMLNFTGLLAVALASSRLNETALKRIRISALTLLVVLPGTYAIFIAFAPLMVRQETFLGAGKQAADLPIKRNWPQKEISATMQAIWTKATGRPLTLLVGDNWTAGLIATAMNPIPFVYTNADPTRASWINPEQIIREGALVVWPDQGRGPPPPLDRLIGQHERHTVKIALRRFPKAPPISIGYAILPPREGTAH